MAPKKTPEEFWRTQLSEHGPSRFERRLLRHLPASPRCKLCNSPFGSPGGPVMRLLGRPPSPNNPTICGTCDRFVKDYPGGTEMEISMLFADVRGSTSLAERMSASEFSQLMRRFYAAATDVLVDSNAMIDKLVGDQVIGFYFPAFAGPHHASVAIQAAGDLLRATEHGDSGGPCIPVGAGVHTGVAYCGTVEGAAGIWDFAVLGDTVNTAARLASLAGTGELLISAAAATAAGIETAGLELRELQVKGRLEPVPVWVQKTEVKPDATIGR